MRRHMLTIYHPWVAMIYFIAAIICSMLTYHPYLVIMSFTCASLYLIFLKGIKKYLGNLKFIATMAAIITVFNFIFSYNGDTVLFYAFDRRFTLEALLYGVSLAGVISSVFLWFACFSEVMTDEKVMYISRRFLPSIALMLSMISKFVPDMIKRAESIRDAHKACVGDEPETKKESVRTAARITSVLMSWSMENSIETADSMRCRGYMAKKRSSYDTYRFRYFDRIAMACISVLFAFVLLYVVMLNSNFEFYPVFTSCDISVFLYIGYAVMLMFPIIIELGDMIKCANLK